MDNRGGIYRGVVLDTDSTTGDVWVAIPSLTGANNRVQVSSVSRHAVDGQWKVPDVGSVVLIASDDANASTLFVVPTYTYDYDLWATDLHGDLDGPVVFTARNDGATTLPANTVVTGQADGSELVIIAANANDAAKPAIGFTVDDIPAGEYGKVAVSGVLKNFNTSSFAANIDLFSGTSGNAVTTPVGLTVPQIIAKVLEVGTEGSILVTIENPAAESLGTFSGVFLGTVYATAGNLGGSASGWIIDSNRIESRGSTQKIVLDGTDGEIYIGTYGVGSYNSASTPFYVNEDGYFSLGNKLTFNPTTSTLDVNGTVTADAGAIGGWTIGSTKLTAGTGSSAVGLASSGTHALYAGSSAPSSAPFSVTPQGGLKATSASITGTITATSGSIGGWAISGNTLLSDGATPITLDSSNGKITVGNTNWANTANRFYVDNAGKFSLGSKLTWDTTNLVVDGTITAASGTIGGWSIDNTKLYAGTGTSYIALSSDNTTEYRTWAGHPTAASAPYYVTKSGGLYASNASIQGNIVATSGSFSGTVTSTSGSIGGFLIGANTLTSGTGSSAVGVTSTAWPFFAGNTTASAAPFRVSNTGQLVSVNAYLGGWTLDSTKLYSGTGASYVGVASSGGYPFWAGNTTASAANFRVSNTGVLTASGASINGAINATSGSFTGYITSASISGSSITGGSISGGYITGGSVSGGYITGGSVNGGYITGGSISGGYITGGSINGSAITIGSNFSVNTAGSLTASNASISGNIVATSGSFTGSVTATAGSIGGFAIGANSLTAGTGASSVGLNTTGYPFYAGSTTASAAPFRVNSTGSLVSTAGSVGGWTIGTSSIYNDPYGYSALNLPGTAGAYPSTPDANDLDILGVEGTKFFSRTGRVNSNDIAWVPAAIGSSLDITGDVALAVQVDIGTPDLTSVGGRVLAARRDGTIDSGYAPYAFSVDATPSSRTFNFSWRDSGGTSRIYYGTVNTINMAYTHWGVTHDVDDGAGNNVVRFYGSTDGTNWTLIETGTQAFTTSHRSNAARFNVGGTYGAGIYGAFGKFYRTKVWNAASFSGSPVLDIDFTAQAIGATTFTATTGQTVTLTGVTAKIVDGTTFLYLPAIAGNYASIPDAAVLDITGDLEVEFGCALVTLTPATSMSLIGRGTADPNRAWALTVGTTGTLSFRWYPTGSLASQVIVGSTATLQSVGITAGQRIRVKVTLDVDNGAGGNDVKFYYSTNDGVTYTQLGSTVTTAGVTSLPNVTADLTINTALGGTELNAKIYKALVRNGIGGTVVFDANFDHQTQFATSFTESSSNSATVTVTSTGRARIERDRDLEMVARVSFDNWQPPGDTAVISKYDGSGFQRGYLLCLTTGGALRFYYSPEGVSVLSHTSATRTWGDGTTWWIKVTWDTDNGAAGRTARFYYAADQQTEPTVWTQLGTDVVSAGYSSTFVNTAPLRAGVFHTDAGMAAAKFYRMIVRNGIGGTSVFDADFTTRSIGTTSFTESTGKTVTINGSASFVGTSPVTLTTTGGYPIYVGSTAASTAPFRVTDTGGLIATSASITGAINATSGSFTGTITAASISGSSLSGSTITGGSISGGYITGGSVSGTSVSGSTITGGSISGGYITGGSVSGSYVTGGSVSGGYITGGSISGSSVTGASLSGGQITIGSNFSVNTAGSLTASNASINGNIVATSGSFTGTVTATSGSIGGWTLGSSSLSSGTGASSVGMSTSGYPFYAGNATAASAPFRVTSTGDLTATSASITGFINATSGSFSGSVNAASINAQVGNVGGFTLGSTSLTAGTGASSVGLNTTGYPFYAGNSTASSAPFRVSSTGALTASNASITGTITGSSITGGSISGGYITGGSISGTSVSGSTITGGSISGGYITGGSVSGSYVTGGSVSGGYITGGSINGSSITIGSNFSVNTAGSLTASNASISGNIVATSGSFTGSITSTSGSIGGFAIGANTLTAGTGASAVGLASDATYPFWAGKADRYTAPFSVRYDGYVTASSVSVLNFYNTGASPAIINGQFTVDSSKVQLGRQIGTGASNTGIYINKTVGTTNDAAWDNYIYADGTARIGNSTSNMTFDGTNLTVTGRISSTSGSIGNWILSTDRLFSGTGASYVGLASSGTHAIWAGASAPSSASFSVTPTGRLVASSASITGFINATSGSFTGSISGASISGTSITGGSISGGYITGGSISGGYITGGSVSGGYVTGGSVSGSYITGGSVSAGYITGSSINGGSITIGSNFSVNTAGSLTASNASISGNVVATSGSFTGTVTSTSGSIGGWTLGSTSLTAGTGASAVGLSTTGYPFYAGSTTASAAPFRVTNTGALTATTASITGYINATSGSFSGTVNAASINAQVGNVGGFTLGATSLTAGTGASAVGLNTTGYPFYAGSTTASAANFRVTNTGALTASGANISGTITSSSISGASISGTTITGGSISGGYITGGSVSGGYITGGSINGSSITIGSNFSVNTAGSLTASNASISGNVVATSGSFTGTVTSTSGTIGGWTLGANSLTAGTGSSAVGLSTTGYPFYAGSTTASAANFRVTNTGTLTATGASLVGDISASAFKYVTGGSTSIVLGTLTTPYTGSWFGTLDKGVEFKADASGWSAAGIGSIHDTFNIGNNQQGLFIYGHNPSTGGSISVPGLGLYYEEGGTSNTQSVFTYVDGGTYTNPVTSTTTTGVSLTSSVYAEDGSADSHSSEMKIYGIHKDSLMSAQRDGFVAVQNGYVISDVVRGTPHTTLTQTESDFSFALNGSGSLIYMSPTNFQFSSSGTNHFSVNNNGRIDATRIILSSNTDADVTSAMSLQYGLQVGDGTGINLVIDNNEIFVRSGTGSSATGSTLYLGLGGSVISSDISDTGGRYFMRTNTGHSNPQRVERGSVTGSTTSSAGDITVTFAEAFSVTPTVIVTPYGSTDLTMTVTTRSTSAFTLRSRTGGTADNAQSRSFGWLAIGPG